MTLEITTDADPAEVALEIYPDVFRTAFSRPGFALIQFKDIPNSSTFRRYMVLLRDSLNRIVTAQRGKRLRFQSLARFDQQTTTKFHLDGGPDESILMLGYEPTQVQSSVALADYVQAAHHIGITPQQFMDNHNPMFVAGERLLKDYIHPLDSFDESRFQIVFINNSRHAWTPEAEHSLGVLHQATILNPDNSKSRIINSTMMSVTSDATDVVSEIEIEEFVSTDRVARKNYTH